MLDDTCYFIGFDTFMEAEITRVLLNKSITQNFIQSITFKDAKKMITKDLLMKINSKEIIKNTSFVELQSEISSISIDNWENYKRKLTKTEFKRNQQLDLFDKQASRTIIPINHWTSGS